MAIGHQHEHEHDHDAERRTLLGAFEPRMKHRLNTDDQSHVCTRIDIPCCHFTERRAMPILREP
jgi:hypothetical protein